MSLVMLCILCWVELSISTLQVYFFCIIYFIFNNFKNKIIKSNDYKFN